MLPIANLSALHILVCNAKAPDPALDNAVNVSGLWRPANGRCLAVTDSVDDVISLIRNELPTWSWGVTAHRDGFRAQVTERSPIRPMPYVADGPLPQLALLRALLSALIGETQKGGDAIAQRIRRKVGESETGPPPAVDRSASVLVGGGPVPEDRSHTKLKANGQQQDYIILTAEERAKGFIEPVRTTYRHVGRRPQHPIRDLTDDEHKQYDRFGYVKYEKYPESEAPKVGRFWTAADLASGCDTITTMARSIAETYARDPSFYGGTFCVTCGKHLPLDEFVWEGTNQIVGSRSTPALSKADGA